MHDFPEFLCVLGKVGTAYLIYLFDLFCILLIQNLGELA